MGALLKHPIVSTVVATLTASAIGAAVSFYVPTFAPVADAIRTAVRFLALDVTLPRWFFWLWALLSIAAVGLISARAYFAANDHAIGEPFQAYQTDEIFGARWRFYTTAAGSVHSLRMFCPVCDHELEDDDLEISIEDTEYSFQCPRCKKVGHVSVGFFQDLDETVRKEAERRVRSGVWKQAKPPKLSN
ncbi:hypothetical protein [Caballeronia novacaledonica]|uniref:Uncharacterized protein n=1 Tax=Caballeronia novacaledonica TaxID=1544861 RepID=A0AA37MIN8_9BURK|nr:hypothetical protein [Caballeronia novacaledonica]GJH28168.1 hypothetical protein CBA19CS42_26650 [Caballeronia novacaledonica]